MKKILFTTIAVMLVTSGAAYAATETEISVISHGTSRSAVQEKIGAPDETDISGYRDIYNLSGGKRAVLRYLDGMVDDGYILVD